MPDGCFVNIQHGKVGNIHKNEDQPFSSLILIILVDVVLSSRAQSTLEFFKNPQFQAQSTLKIIRKTLHTRHVSVATASLVSILTCTDLIRFIPLQQAGLPDPQPNHLPDSIHYQYPRPIRCPHSVHCPQVPVLVQVQALP